ncbi:unnamed protein product, partial [Dicrocoelium dendriticum]
VVERMVTDRFASTVDIWIYKPHVVHRRIFGTDVIPSDDVSRLSRTVVTRHSLQNSSFHEIIHRSNSESLFESDHIKYSLYMDGGKIVSNVLYDDGLSIFTSDWIFRELPKKLNRLLAQSPKSMTASLSLLDVGAYHEVYCALKSKHAKRIVEDWCEKTDPLKFVHEDLGIAAYLIVYSFFTLLTLLRSVYGNRSVKSQRTSLMLDVETAFLSICCCLKVFKVSVSMFAKGQYGALIQIWCNKVYL